MIHALTSPPVIICALMVSFAVWISWCQVRDIDTDVVEDSKEIENVEPS